MEHIQIQNTNLDDLENFIVEIIKRHVDEIKKLFSVKSPVSELMTRDEVASFFKINLSTLHAWTKKGKLKAYAVEGRVYYKRAEVEQAIVELN